MGFGPGFTAIVRLLYVRVVSCIIINEYFSELVTQQGGVRQGCLPSPLLYVLYLEPLVERLRRELAFQGFHIPGAGGIRAKVSAYADDMTMFFGRDRDFSAVECVLKEFSDATGARINRGSQRRCVRERGQGGSKSWGVTRCARMGSRFWGWSSGERGQHPKELGLRLEVDTSQG